MPSEYAKAYDKIRPSVVRVVSYVKKSRLKEESRAACRKARRQAQAARPRARPNADKAGPRTRVENGVGTGVVIVDKGIILTNLHVVSGADRIKVTFSDGLEATATITGVQPENDLAVLQASKIPDDMIAATMRSTGDLTPGDKVLAVGFPFGIGPSASGGVVSGLKRVVPLAGRQAGDEQPDPVRRGGQPRQFRRPAGHHGRRSGRHRHRHPQPHAGAHLPGHRLCRADRERRLRRRPAALLTTTFSLSQRDPPLMESTTRQDTATAQLMEQILYEVKRVVVGQDRFLERVMVAMLAQGHLLVEGVPGLAKTLTVKTLANTMRGQFKRIQFTPDLVPADLVGTRIYNQKTGDFSTALGPVFTNLLLADEINRAPAKVQSALLEVMQERQVTIAGETHKVPEPVPGDGHAEPDRDRRHLSAARSAGRPLHDEGAGRLPDRRGRVRHRRARHRPGRRRSRRWPRTEQLAALQRECRRVYVDPSLIQYAVKLVSATRTPEKHGLKDLGKFITFGASPRATINLTEGARALAMLRGRTYALPEDMTDLVPDVLRHRLVLSYEALSEGLTRRRAGRQDHGQDPVAAQAAGT